MTKSQEFLDFLDKLIAATPNVEMSANVKAYIEVLRNTKEKEKPLFTENGKKILSYLQENPDTIMWKARDIAEGLFITSKTASGAMQKLTKDGYVEKVGQNPVVYALTDLGKTIEIIDEYKGEM